MFRSFSFPVLFAADEPPAGGDGSNAGGKPDTGPDGGAGGEPPDPNAKPDTGPDGGGDGEPDWKAEAEKWKSLARKHEDASKKNSSAQKELEKLKAEGMSEQEKAVAEAEARGRQAALAVAAEKLAGAEIKAALTGVVKNPAEIVGDLNLAKYVTDTGDVDAEAVAALRARFLEQLPAKDPADLKQGNRGGSGPSQLTRAELAKMTPEQIDQAHREGRLNEMQGLPTS